MHYTYNSTSRQLIELNRVAGFPGRTKKKSVHLNLGRIKKRLTFFFIDSCFLLGIHHMMDKVPLEVDMKDMQDR
jgi:hypothetical protein